MGFRPKPIFTASHRLPPPSTAFHRPSYAVSGCLSALGLARLRCDAQLDKLLSRSSLPMHEVHATRQNEWSLRDEGAACGPAASVPGRPGEVGGITRQAPVRWVFSSSGHRLPSASTAGCLPQRTSFINEAPLEPLPCGIHAPFAVTRRAYALIPNSRRNRGQQL